MAFTAGPLPRLSEQDLKGLTEVVWGKFEDLEEEQYSKNFEDITFTYNGDGTIATVIKRSVTTTFAYNPDLSVDTISRGGLTKTFSYNGDGTINTVVES